MGLNKYNPTRVMVSVCKKITFFLGVLLLPGILMGFSSQPKFQVKKASPVPSLQKRIDPAVNLQHEQWIGADVATSIPITKNHVIWLFGDTLIGFNKNGRRYIHAFIHNSVGVMKHGVMKKYYRIQNGEPASIFQSKKKNTYLWVMSGAMINKKLVLLAALKQKDEGLQTKKSVMIVVSNPLDKPTKWKYVVMPQLSSIPQCDRKIKKASKMFQPLHYRSVHWTMALVNQKNKYYIFGELKHKTMVAIFNKNKLLKIQAVKGLPGTSETTIQYNKFFGWYCVQIPPLSVDVHLYTASNLLGPWFDQGVIYSIKHHDRFVVYAAKAHQELARQKKEIVFTYNTNINPFDIELKDQMQITIANNKYKSIYIPQFVSVTF